MKKFLILISALILALIVLMFIYIDGRKNNDLTSLDSLENSSIVDNSSESTTTTTTPETTTTPSTTTTPNTTTKPSTTTTPKVDLDDDAINAFVSLSYYDADLKSRYISYKSKNPGLPYETCITYVNIGLDKPFYTNTVVASEPDDLLVLVNKYSQLSSGYEPSDLVKIDSRFSTRDINVLRAPAEEAFVKLCSDALALGYTIKGHSAYRSYASQKYIYNSYLQNDPVSVVDTYSARPGFSEHQTGLAIDVIGSTGGTITSFGKTKESPWVNENAHKYGYIVRYTAENQHITGYQPEPWHLRYVGVDVATYIYENGITFDEFLAMGVNV